MAKEMKSLYITEMLKEVEIEKTEVTKNEAGAEVTTKTKVKEKQPVKVIVAAPTRKLRDEAEVAYASQIGKLVEQGVLTRHLLRKRIIDGGGGFFTNQETKEFEDLLKKLQNLEIEYQRLILISEADRTPDEKVLFGNIQKEYSDIQQKLQAVEQTQQALFNNTAENIANNRMTVWWALQLTHIQEPGSIEPKPMFEGKTSEEKYESYDKLEEDADQFYLDVASRVSMVIALWRNGLAADQAGFDTMIAEINKPATKEPDNTTTKE
jgi:hypothetical protein